MPQEAHTKAVDVDCSDRFKYIAPSAIQQWDPAYTHAWYFTDKLWYQDLALVIDGSVDRNYFPHRKSIGINDYTLAIV